MLGTHVILEKTGEFSEFAVVLVLPLNLQNRWLTKKTMKTGDYGLAAAFGPGFSAEVLLLQWN